MKGRVLIIAGSDSGGGAGIQADIKTVTALGGYAMTAITALTAQNTVGVRGVHCVPPAFVHDQIAAIVDDCAPAATKTGMLGTADVVRAVAAAAGQGGLGALVVDPVMVATSGDRLLTDDAVRALRELLIPAALLVTPNVAETAALTGVVVRTTDHAVTAARALVALGAGAALIKGGPGDDPEHVVDVLVVGDGEPAVWSRRRVAVAAAHGTGCTLSAAIAAGLAQGRDLVRAVRDAGEFVHRGLATAFAVGAGAVPVNHLHLRTHPPEMR